MINNFKDLLLFVGGSILVILSLLTVHYYFPVQTDIGIVIVLLLGIFTKSIDFLASAFCIISLVIGKICFWLAKHTIMLLKAAKIRELKRVNARVNALESEIHSYQRYYYSLIDEEKKFRGWPSETARIRNKMNEIEKIIDNKNAEINNLHGLAR